MKAKSDAVRRLEAPTKNVVALGRPIKCVSCGAKHHSRYRKHGTCLSCHIDEMVAEGLSPRVIGVRLGLPTFLIQELVDRQSSQ